MLSIKFFRLIGIALGFTLMIKAIITLTCVLIINQLSNFKSIIEEYVKIYKIYNLYYFLIFTIIFLILCFSKKVKNILSKY